MAMEVEEREERDTPVDIHKLAKLRELRFCSKSLLEGASASASRTAMVLEKYRGVFLVLLREYLSTDPAIALYMKANL